MRTGLLTTALAVALASSPAHAGEPRQRLPFSDDVALPPPLPKPLDRAFAGEFLGFDGERIALRWTWKSEAELEDFESFIPVRATTRGGIEVKHGRLAAEGTAGIRLRLGMLSDLEVHVAATLQSPHDLGVVLALPGSSDDSILCLVQDVHFTRFDGAAGNANMINKLGGIPAASAGSVEFRYVARNLEPRLSKGQEVQFDVVRKGAETTFTITPKGREAVALYGRDTDTAFTRFTPGLYASGGAAEFGELRISGKVDREWCDANGVLPYVASNLLHPANRWKPPERKLAEIVERFLHPDPNEKDPKKVVTAAAVVALVGDVKVPLIIRLRAAEALMERGAAEGVVADRLAALIDAKDPSARTLAWQLLRPKLPWHFRYEVDADPKVRREAALLIAAYLREREEADAQGKVFVDGYWYTPERADAIRGAWENAWEVRTPRIRLRTNLPRVQAEWFLEALEAEYRELVELVGKEPPAEKLPLSVFVFAKPEDFKAFCAQHAYESKSSWGRFVDLDRNVSFATFDRNDGLANTTSQVAKQFIRFATGKFWPVWFDEGRAAWFGNADYGTVAFDGTTLTVGRIDRRSPTLRLLVQSAGDGRMPGVAEMLSRDPRNLTGEGRRLWYVHAWAFHQWLVDVAPDSVRYRFAEWQSMMEKLPTDSRTVEETGLRVFLAFFAKDIGEVDAQFKEWVKSL